MSTSSAIPVDIIMGFPFDAADCAYENRKFIDSNTCSVDRDSVLLEKNPALKYKDIIKNIDMSDMLCTDQKCLSVFSDTLIYRDKDHLSVKYTYFVKDVLENKLKSVFNKIK